MRSSLLVIPGSNMGEKGGAEVVWGNRGGNQHSAAGSMRRAISQMVSSIIPELEGHVYDLHPPAGTVESNYAVIMLGEEVWKSAWAGYRQVIRLLLYTDRPMLHELDMWSEQLIQELHRRRIVSDEGKAFTLHYLGVPEADKVDPMTGKTARLLRFGIYLPEVNGGGADEEPDEWLSHLAAWTGQFLGSRWQIYQSRWPSSREEYAVMWRLTDCEVLNSSASMVEVRKSFTGHVVSPTADMELQTAIALAGEIGDKAMIPIDAGERRYMTVVDVTANLQADPILDGQVKLKLMQRKMRAVEDAAWIRRVHIHPNMK